MNHRRSRPHRTIVARAVVSVALVLGAAACGSDDDDPASEPADTESITTQASSSTESTSTGGATDTTADGSSGGAASSDQEFPDVIDATAERNDDTWTISATISSPYDTPERYADAWRVVGPDDTVYGERILTHDHASEQPFTRSENGIEIPDDVDEITIEGRDLENGYGGETFALTLPR